MALDGILLGIYSKDKYSGIPLEEAIGAIVDSQGPPRVQDQDYIGGADYSALYKQLDEMLPPIS